MLLLFISGDGAAVPAATDDSAAASNLHATEHCDAVGVTEVVSTTGGAAFWAVGLRDPNIFTIVAGATLAAATTGATSLTGLTTARDFGEGATDALTVVLRVAAVASPATASSTCCHGYWIL